MAHMAKLEGPAYTAYLLLRRQIMIEAARINNMNFRTAWGIGAAPAPAAVTYENLLPGPDASLKITDLEPEDLGITVDATTEHGYLFNLTTTGENTKEVDKTIDNGRVVGIYGIHLRAASAAYAGEIGPQLEQIDVNIGGREARVWPVRPAYDTNTNELYFLDPIYVTEAKTLTIDLWAATNTASVRLTFLGLYAEPKE